MRVLLCTNIDLIGNYVANLFIPALKARGHEVRVLLSHRIMAPKKDVPAGLWWLKFFEHDLPVDTLFPLLERQEQETGEWKSFGGLARQFGVGVEEHPDIRTPQALAYMRGFQPDLILSNRFGLLFKQEHMDIARHGIWNIHSGKLPQYRGVMPTFRTLMAGDDDIGITMHRVPDATIDTGDIIGERRLRVEQGRSMLWHVRALYPLSLEMFLESLTHLERGEPIPARPQPLEGSQYFTFPTEAELAAFAEKGWKLVDPEEYTGWLARYVGREKAEELLQAA